ncbi:unnamed protein product [Zymoseptoria tritici ST99CH_3D7]|uniref:Uncharacterized protein n=1 Tax=Zymoseptoria tritici (strain ST99CH_3D7) TaxID=1276538 RepID=A0A1X7RI29_ZYMT9|nr:unnamed protein product [Zymoseptoria tritici ST99CH_3D7]
MASITSNPSSRSISNTLLTLLFILISALSLYGMRLSPVTHVMADIFRDMWSTPDFHWPTNGVLARKVYTGIPLVDYFLKVLGTAFLPGSAGWERKLWLLHVEFLVSFGAVVGVLNVEAGRRGNQGRWIAYTSLWSLLYQNGGAVVLPIYYILHARATSSSPSSFHPSSQLLPTPLASTLNTALLLGYWIPTFFLLYPIQDPDVKQLVIAVWQFSPMYVNLIWWIESQLTESTTTTTTSSSAKGKGGRSDLPSLRVLYATIITICTATHLGVISSILTTTSPGVSFSSVYLLHYRSVFTPYESLHYIFQVDFWGIFLATGIWCLVGVRDLRNLGITDVGYVSATVGLGVVSVLAGPGAAVAGFWWWREEKLAGIPIAGGDGKGK